MEIEFLNSLLNNSFSALVAFFCLYRIDVTLSNINNNLTRLNSLLKNN